MAKPLWVFFGSERLSNRRKAKQELKRGTEPQPKVPHGKVLD